MDSRLRRNTCAVICLASQITLASPALAVPFVKAAGTGRTTAYASPGIGLGKILQGRASLTNDVWQRFYEAGTQALDKRFYEQAEQRLDSALTELRRRNVSDVRLIQTKEALGRTYLGLERYGDAERVLSDAVFRAEKLGPSGNGAKSRASEALAETLVALHKYDRAEALAKEMIDQSTSDGVSEPRAQGRALLTLGDALAAQGLSVDAASNYKKAIADFERAEADQLDLADASYRYALLLRAEGNEEEARKHFDRAFRVYDSAAQFNKALAQAPRLNIHWEEGSPRARVVPDQDYPLKYVVVDGLRIAATLVRSENVIVALISLSNCSRNRKELSIGKVSLQQLAPKNKPFRFVHPTQLDVDLEAEHVTELTWRRRWLNHIEKTRRIPGYLKDGVLDVDNFFGNNTFGPYGHWQTVARSETPIVTREQFLYSPHRDNGNEAADFLTHTPSATRPTFLDAGDSKTGQVYFGQERLQKAVLKIEIGNVVAEIPFDSAGPRIHD